LDRISKINRIMEKDFDRRNMKADEGEVWIGLIRLK
jgi:hypothetical protein